MIAFAEALFLRTDGKVPTGAGHFASVAKMANLEIARATSSP